jgi:hypothetical protein
MWRIANDRGYRKRLTVFLGAETELGTRLAPLRQDAWQPFAACSLGIPMSIYSPAARRRVVNRFKNRQGLLLLGPVSLAMIAMLWLMLSGYVRIDVD